MNNGQRPPPQGWQWKRLGDVSRVVSGSTPRSGIAEYWNGNVVWITPTDLGALLHKSIYTSARKITVAGYESCNTELVPVGTVVLSSRAPIGYLGIARVWLCTNQGCKSLVPLDGLDSEYLYFTLLASVDSLRRLGSGATFAEVSKSQLESFHIPVPPLAEQRRIAADLNDQMAAVEQARAAAEAQLGAARALLGSYLRQAFRGITPLTVGTEHVSAPSGWKWCRLTALARLESGHTPSRRHPEWWGGSIPWIALPDIRNLDGKIAHGTLEYTNEAGIANSSARVLPVGTVALSRTASVGFVTIMGKPMATSQDFVNWVCGPELNPTFLMYLFQASRKYIRSVASGAIHKTVYMPTVEAFEVCVPPIDQQTHIAATLQKQSSSTSELLQVLDGQLADIDRLPHGLLRQAFTGAL